MSRADAYLTIAPDYASEAGGWRWSLGCDAVEDEVGRTLALTEELALVLEGVFASPPVPPFPFVLHLLALLKHPPDRPGALARLHTANSRARGPGRNVGLLVAELCRGLPPFADPPAWHDLELALKRRTLFGERHQPELVQATVLGPAEFAQAVAEKLAGWDDAALAHWLKFGGPPAAAGRALAEAAESFPQRVGAFLELLRKRERLVGAATLAPALDAALTLPPRRPRPESIPQGGYVDVTTRGDPDRLLPSQFALESDEFVRRFAERELLYFRREEPHRQSAPERWLVLDQGVRTWGPVRLGLTAGVVALLGKDPARFGRLRLSLTSHPTPLDPAEMSLEALADHLEASDLAPNPGDALTLVLDEPPDPPDAPRDVILFTHPRNLAEADVRGAVRLRRANDRVFTVAVADDGRAELGEWTPSGLLPLRSFRVDLEAGEAARVLQPVRPGRGPAPVAGWAGDVEPVPFPFRAGLAADVEQLGFDADGNWVVVVGRGGMVHAKNLTDDGQVEVLPRAFRDGEVLRRVHAVLGVAGGVVVCGEMPLHLLGSTLTAGASSPPEVFAAAHYDFATRTVKLHPLRPVGDQMVWGAFPDLHCVVVRKPSAGGGSAPGCALDLATGARFPVDPDPTRAGLTSRARLAWSRAGVGVPDPVPLPVYSSRPESLPYLNVADDVLILHRSPRKWATLRPLSEGKPLAKGTTPLRAELAGDVLAVLLKGGSRPVTLYTIRGPDAAVLRELTPASPAHVFALSRDGGRLARQTGGRAVEVRETAPGGSIRAALYSGGYHTRVHLHLDAARLRLRVGQYEHTFTLNEVPFRHERTPPRAGPLLGSERRPQLNAVGTAAGYDRERFGHLTATGPWVAGFDRLGQVVLLDRSGRLVMTMIVRRELAAAWLPDGTRWGAAALLGGPPHPNAAVRIGMALQAAAEGYEWKSRSD